MNEKESKLVKFVLKLEDIRHSSKLTTGSCGGYKDTEQPIESWLKHLTTNIGEPRAATQDKVNYATHVNKYGTTF